MVIPLIALPLLAVGVLAYLGLWQKSEQQSQIQVENHVANLADDFNNRIRDARLILESLANDSLLKEYLLTEDEEDRYALMQRPMLRNMAGYQSANPDLYEIRLLLPDGFEELRMTSRALVNRHEDESQSGFFIAATNQLDNPEPFIGINPDNNQPALFVSKAIFLRNNVTESFNSQPRLRGILSITQQTGRIADGQLPPPWEAGRVMLTDRLGAAVIPKGEQSAAPASTVHFEPGSFTTATWHQITVAGTQSVHFALQLSNDLYLHTLLPEARIQESARQIGALVLYVIGLALLIAIPLLLFLLHHQILKPIGLLSHALNNLGKRQNRVQVTQVGNDEIGELCRSFNRMSIDLFESNERIRNLAFIDSLTGLPNRVLFRRNLERAIANSKREQKLLGLLFLDLDNFKHVNDTMGHPVGDRLLSNVAERLMQNTRASDLMGRIDIDDLSANFSRLGGDEFTVLLPHLENSLQAAQVAERIIGAFSQPVTIDKHQIYVGCSIGIAIMPDDANGAEELITNADVAMYQAKKSGKNRYHFFSQSIGEQNKERAKIEQRLHHAVEACNFTLYYQPIVDSLSHRVSSYEALIRWSDERLGPVAPDRFIHIAEENGLIVPIGAWVMNEACRQLKEWHEQGHTQLRMGINLSVVQLCRPDIVQEISNDLLKHGLTGRDIYIELTETAIIQGENQVLENLQKLRTMAIEVALDDFGTGYSSLSYLKNLPIDILKIDRSFISALGEDNNCIILSAIITMAHALGLKVIAEGVETDTDLMFVTKEGCDMVQGFLFSRPVPADKAIALQDASSAISKCI